LTVDDVLGGCDEVRALVGLFEQPSQLDDAINHGIEYRTLGEALQDEEAVTVPGGTLFGG
jgi:hypothetical protein